MNMRLDRSGRCVTYVGGDVVEVLNVSLRGGPIVPALSDRRGPCKDRPRRYPPPTRVRGHRPAGGIQSGEVVFSEDSSSRFFPECSSVRARSAVRERGRFLCHLSPSLQGPAHAPAAARASQAAWYSAVRPTPRRPTRRAVGRDPPAFDATVPIRSSHRRLGPTDSCRRTGRRSSLSAELDYGGAFGKNHLRRAPVSGRRVGASGRRLSRHPVRQKNGFRCGNVG